MFSSVKLQSWFGEKRERYWAVEVGGAPSQGLNQTCDTTTPSHGSGSEDDEIKADVLKWEQETEKERLKFTQRAHTTEIDLWLRFTGWEQVLAQSQHNLVIIYAFTDTATATELDL
jgi:hypothetical protein